MTWPRPVPVVGDPTSALDRATAPTEWALSEQARASIYAVISARRDIRRFRPVPVDEAILARVLEAGHQAPSVGHSQPWRFIVVTQAPTREQAALMAARERQRQASLLNDDSRRRMLDLQLDGISEAPLGVVVCCDRRTPGPGVLGRATFADADLWSCACAIENMWLAARAEGLGMGWVTLFPPDELAALLGLPADVETLGWLCLGWPDERPPAPGLERAGWSRKAPLDHVVVRERWGGVAPGPPVSHLRAPGPGAVVGARDQADRLLTAPGSLGVLDLALDRLVALGFTSVKKGALVLVAADHPVTRHGVSAYPATVTADVLAATVAGVSLGATAARAVSFEVIAVDAGTKGGPVAGALHLPPSGPRGDLVNADALTPGSAAELVEGGRVLARSLLAPVGPAPGGAVPVPLVALGEVGTGNTTVAAAMCSALLGLSAVATVGLGAGGDSVTLERKLAAVEAALARALGDARRLGPLPALAALGGPEIAVLTGVVLGVAELGGAIVLDGLVTSVAALCAVRLEPAVAAHLVAGQRSRERAHPVVLEELGLEPVLDLRLRAGEGVGALLCAQLLVSGLALRAGAARVTP